MARTDKDEFHLTDRTTQREIYRDPTTAERNLAEAGAKAQAHCEQGPRIAIRAVGAADAIGGECRGTRCRNPPPRGRLGGRQRAHRWSQGRNGWQGGGETAYTDANGLATIDLGDDEAGVDFKSAIVTTDGKTPSSVRHNIKEDDYEGYSAEKKFVDPFVVGVNNFWLQIDAKANLQRARAFAIFSALSISRNFAISIGATILGPTIVTYPDDSDKPEGASQPLSHAIYDTKTDQGFIGYTTDVLSDPDTIAHTNIPSTAA